MHNSPITPSGTNFPSISLTSDMEFSIVLPIVILLGSVISLKCVPATASLCP